MASPKLSGKVLPPVSLLVIVMPSCSTSRGPASSKQPIREGYSAGVFMDLNLVQIVMPLNYKHFKHLMVITSVNHGQINLVTASVLKVARTC